MANVKKCPNCQADNDVSANFCYDCGSKLPEQSSSINRCLSCGFDNPEEAKFCAACGAKISDQSENKQPLTENKPRSRKKRKSKIVDSPAKNHDKQPQENWYLKAIGIVAIGVVIFAIYSANTKQQTPDITKTYNEQLSNNQGVENQVFVIASKFVCACGSCPREPLETCACPTAKRERDYIRSALLSGQAPDQIVNTVSQQFGGLKASSSSIPDKNKLSLSLPSLLSTKGESTNADVINTANKPASMATRLEIISQFSCPCGQCSIDKLKDCECSHPRGAREVKGFIDEKIAEGGYTVKQVIDIVENQYGGRIR